jgi:hypothetical protein
MMLELLDDMSLESNKEKLFRWSQVKIGANSSTDRSRATVGGRIGIDKWIGLLWRRVGGAGFGLS